MHLWVNSWRALLKTSISAFSLHLSSRNSTAFFSCCFNWSHIPMSGLPPSASSDLPNYAEAKKSMTAKRLLNRPDNTARQGLRVSMVLSNTKHTKQSRHWEHAALPCGWSTSQATEAGRAPELLKHSIWTSCSKQSRQPHEARDSQGSTPPAPTHSLCRTPHSTCSMENPPPEGATGHPSSRGRLT